MHAASLKYFAFISYSHQDKAWGDWLHKGLEHYKIPKTLVGRETPRGEAVPTRIFPIFRDREELPTAVDLGAIINHALDQSRYLIVICSPASARSQWVNQEILNYKKLGRENRVLAIIVDGEPNAADGKPGFTAEQECFPPALKFKIGADGNLTDERTEPIAADARPHADGKNNALLNLIAGVVGVNYDDLRQREAARQRRRRQFLAIATGLVLAGAWFVSSRFAAEKREKSYQAAVAELGRARQLLADKQPALAATTALQAIESAEAIGRELEPAWWVLRRALDSNRLVKSWNASSDTINEIAFDESGRRLLTFSRGQHAARLWSIPDGGSVATLAAEKRIDFATFTPDGEKVVTLHSWRVEPKSYNDIGSEGLDLMWWNATTGARDSTLTIPAARFFSLRTRSTTPPAWIVADEYNGDSPSYRLIRLSDGWANQSLPAPKQTSGSGPLFVAECGVVLLVDPSEGVSLFTLGDDGAARGRLEGIVPLNKLRLSGLVPSVDCTAFAALVWNGDKPIASGVWQVSDGKRLTGATLDAGSLSSMAWIGAAGATGLTGQSDELIAPLAAALGRRPLPPAAYDAAGLIWRESAGNPAPVAAVLGQHGEVKVIRPEDGWESTIQKEAECMALSPDGSLIASGDNYGGVFLWRTDAPVSTESVLPEGTTIAKDLTEFPASAGDKVWLQPAPDRLLAWDIAARRVSTEITGLVPQPETWLKFAINPESGWLAATPSLPVMQPVPAGWKTSFYDLPTGRLLGELPAAEFLLAPRGRRALGPGINGWAIVHASGAQLATVDVRPAGPIDPEWSTAAVFSPDGAQVLVARGDGKIEVFDSDTGVSKRIISFAEDQKTSVNKLSVDPSYRWALVATHDKSWRIDLTSGRSDGVFANEDRSNHWTFLDGGNLLVGATGSLIKWWTFPELKPVAQAKVEGTAAAVLLGPDKSELFIKIKWEDSLMIVDRNTGSVRTRLSGVIALDPTLRNAALKVSVDGNDSLRIIRLSDGEIIAERFDLSPSSAAFAADGSRVIYEHDKKFVSFALPYEAAALRQRAATLRQPPLTKPPSP